MIAPSGLRSNSAIFIAQTIDIVSVIVYNASKMYSVKEAASKLGISESHCRRLLEKGEIKGKKLGHDWVVLSLDYKRKRKPKRR
jgi:excisionase family DNA binding protein